MSPCLNITGIVNSIAIAIVGRKLARIGDTVTITVGSTGIDIAGIFDSIVVAIEGRCLTGIWNLVVIAILFETRGDVTGIGFTVIVAVGRIADGALAGIDDEVAIQIEVVDVCRDDLEDLSAIPVTDVDLSVSIFSETGNPRDTL